MASNPNKDKASAVLLIGVAFMLLGNGLMITNPDSDSVLVEVASLSLVVVAAIFFGASIHMNTRKK